MSGTEKDLKSIIRAEYIKCATDPVYFMKKYCLIQHPTKGKIPFALFPYQEELTHDIQEKDRVIILKSRQLGISTLSAGYSLWMMLFHTDKNILVVAIDQNTSKNLVTKVSVMFESLAILVAKSAGLKVIVGAVVSLTPISRAVKVPEEALIALFASSSTVVPIAI